MKPFNFPGGESHISVPFDSNVIVNENPIRWDLHSADDIMRMLLFYNVQPQAKEYGMVIPYFPYARQDRIINDGEPCSVQVMADLVNSIGAKFVEIWDPHSNVTPALINNVRIVEAHKFLPYIPHYQNVIAPDAGATSRAIKAIQFLNFQRPQNTGLIQAVKTRNTMTGEITGMKVLDGAPRNSSALVVDDICDGGRTFIELAKAMPIDVRLSLYVTHGIFSKGLNELKEYYDRIFTANLFNKNFRDEVTILQREHECTTSQPF